jgi:hypothetical protein
MKNLTRAPRLFLKTVLVILVGVSFLLALRTSELLFVIATVIFACAWTAFILLERACHGRKGWW